MFRKVEVEAANLSPIWKDSNIHKQNALAAANKEFCTVTEFFAMIVQLRGVFRSHFLHWYPYSQLNIPLFRSLSPHTWFYWCTEEAPIYWALEVAFLGIESELFCGVGLTHPGVTHSLLSLEAPRARVAPCIGRLSPGGSVALGLQSWGWGHPLLWAHRNVPKVNFV